MDSVIQFQASDANGRDIGTMFAAVADPGDVLEDFGQFKRRQIVLSFQRVPRGQRSAPGLPPARRSSLFSQRITYEVGAGGDTLDVGTNDVRAAILQFGGTIVPRNAKFLAVPVDPKAEGKRPADFDLELVPRKGRPSLLVLEKKNKAGEVRNITVMFVLLPSVTLPARPYLFWIDADEKYLLTALQRRFEGAA